ncbi:type II toxin-antitoxin system ParD family antitoxin [Terasakiella sp. SH-1]|uniref:type II toxin-antitoxin system ParD family antitoxin n=1 Tax=Terasakiella sp. SH-1 TaxID=2560057 RepID=UPI001073D6C9|nr:type II toxin-antitoxin system ParD family antitoxin [Terasakiella sp. SH-1]
MATMNVSLPDTMREWVDGQVKSGVYANASDYVRDLIRKDQRQRELINLALMEGEQSGVSQRKVGDIVKAAKAQLSGA